MLTLIYGDDITASRNFFIAYKQKYPEASSFEGQDVTLTNLTQALEGGGLFSDDKTVFIEHLIAKKKTSSEIKSIALYLLEQSKESNIILWENKDLEKTILTLFKGSTLKQFKLPQSLFLFLDAIRPNNNTAMVQLFHDTVQNMEEEAVFHMLVRHFRLLLALHKEAGGNTLSNPIDEVKRMQDWQKGKLQKQSTFFTLKQLIEIYEKLFDLEKRQKTSTLTLPLRSSIDIFLLSI